MIEASISVPVFIAIVIGLTAAIRSIVGDRYVPIIAIIIGVILSLGAYGAGFYPNIFTSVIGGLIVGLSSMGLYSGAKKTAGR